MKVLFVTSVAVIAMAFSSAATADNYYGGSPGQRAQMAALIYGTFGTGWRGQAMLCIAKRESGLDPHASNYRDSNGGSYGLFQMNGVHRWRSESLAQFQRRMWNPTTHMVAVRRLARGGLGPWGGGC